MARLRVYGEPVPDPRLLPATIDLAALENGAVVTGCSNMFYSSPADLLLRPGQARVMETAGRPPAAATEANDWVAVRLACAGLVEVAELEPPHFVAMRRGGRRCGVTVLTFPPRTALQPDTRHRFAVSGSPVAGEVRLDIDPTAASPGCGCSAGLPRRHGRGSRPRGSCGCCPRRSWRRLRAAGLSAAARAG